MNGPRQPQQRRRLPQVPLLQLRPQQVADRAVRRWIHDVRQKLVLELGDPRGDGFQLRIDRQQQRPSALAAGLLPGFQGRIRQSLTISSGGSGTVIDSDPAVGVGIGAKIDAEGRFRIDRLIPGQRSSARIYLDQGRLSATAFENLILCAGELRDHGDLRLNLSTDAKSPADPQN